MSASTLALVQRFCAQWQVSGFHALLETNVFEENQLADTLARLLKLDRVYNLAPPECGAQARRKVPYELAAQWECLPNQLRDDGGLELVMADPTLTERLSYFRQNLRCPVHFAVGTRSEIVRAIDDYYPLPEQLPFLQRRQREGEDETLGGDEE